MAEEQKKVEVKKKKDRSVAYPSIPLQEAVELVSVLRTNLGKGPYSREEAAKGIGYSSLSGASAGKIAALVYYGLLTRSGNIYAQSELAEHLIFPTPTTEKAQILARSALSPALFEKIARMYAGQSLPSLLENVLIREGIGDGAAKDVARIFRETLLYAGLLQNGVVLSAPDAPHPISLNELGAASAPIQSDARVSGGQLTKAQNVFAMSGDGWELTVKSVRPISSKVKKILIEATESLDAQSDDPVRAGA